MDTYDQQALAADFQRLGLTAGDTVFVHSALSTLGHVEGGADTVIAALLSVVGHSGTLAAPGFTYEEDPDLFDIANQPSSMGRISEHIRTHPRARRSPHRTHSISAIGPHAETLIHQGASAWAADGPFWQFVALDAYILMLGVGYSYCTFFHLIEQMVQVSYREWVQYEGVLREADGYERPLTTRTFRQTEWSKGNDFNKFGTILEREGLVQVRPAGNAIARLFKARDALHLGIAAYRKDPELFVRDGADQTLLKDGVHRRWQHYVVDPDKVYKKL